MTQERIAKIAKWSSTAEIQKWSSSVGMFAADAHKLIAPLVKVACGKCPFQNFINVGGCLREDCPIHMVMHTIRRAAPRAANATKEI